MDIQGLLAEDFGLRTGLPHPCPYLDGLMAREKLLVVPMFTPEVYELAMAWGWRRSGPIYHKPACDACQACRPLRVAVSTFRPSRAQRRALRRNADVAWELGSGAPTQDKYELFVRYQRGRHDGDMCTHPAEFAGFLYDSPLPGREFLAMIGDRLVGVALTDEGPEYLSAVYSWYDPDESARGLGTWMILKMIETARRLGKSHVYLGYHIAPSPKMAYKNRFRPCEISDSQGAWHPAPDDGSDA